MQRAYRSRGVILLNQGAYELAAADLDRAGYTDGAKVYLGLARMALANARRATAPSDKGAIMTRCRSRRRSLSIASSS